MKLEIIVVRDIKANCYGQPQFVPSLGAAVRAFGDEVNREDRTNQLYMHPEDFELYHVGWYGDADAKFTLFESPKQIALASTYAKGDK